ncbi:hypothetical protein QHH03_30120, partial [Aphanizomenon sp. 202]|nr:hypothetical protein [Aphanizomenon sp. 202]
LSAAEISTKAASNPPANSQAASNPAANRKAASADIPSSLLVQITAAAISRDFSCIPTTKVPKASNLQASG